MHRLTIHSLRICCMLCFCTKTSQPFRLSSSSRLDEEEVAILSFINAAGDGGREMQWEEMFFTEYLNHWNKASLPNDSLIKCKLCNVTSYLYRPTQCTRLLTTNQSLYNLAPKDKSVYYHVYFVYFSFLTINIGRDRPFLSVIHWYVSLPPLRRFIHSKIMEMS